MPLSCMIIRPESSPTVTKVDFISGLPLEIAEEIVGYLEGEDILVGCQVCREWKRRLDHDTTWKRLCQQRGWVMDAPTSSGWRSVYWLNRNWSTGRYRQYTISGDDLHPTQHRSFQMDGNYLIVPRANSLYKSSGINVWDLTDEPKLHQVIFNDLGPKGKQFKAYKKYLAQQIGSFIRVHRNINGTYKHFKLLHFKENVKFIDGIFQVVSDVDEIKNVENFTPPIFEDELALDIEIESNTLAIHKHKKFVYLWTLNPWKKVSAINLDGDSVAYIRILPGRLFCVMSNSPIFRVFDTVKNHWILELAGNTRNPFLEMTPCIPTLHLSPNMISSYYKSGTESTFKLWNSRGELVRIIDLPRNVRFQCSFIEDLVLITSSEQTISILSSNLEEIRTIEIDSPCEAMDAGPGQIIILVYQTFYQVWDWKTGTKKYTIDLPLSLIRQVNSYYCAHEIHHYNHKIKINILNFTCDVTIPVVE